ncbi:ATP-binding protein [Bacillus haynesii]|uniref:AAA family ATPase n=1 Tax=Bacillus haynesii TaxID=1925021 RepID=UPI002DB77033|nr:ATP-binding protein [Bacillus haynesii]MEC1551564.1 ATP-binding protein [Bacillus haynesii]
MLVEFKVENFMSIKNEVTFTMQTAPRLKRFKESNTFLTKPVNILKSSVIFGPNGSGKTNLFKALTYMKHLILDDYSNTKKTLESLPYHPYKMDTDKVQNPTKFQIIILINGELFKYEIHYNKERILFENLQILKDTNDINYFKREYDTENNTYQYELFDGVKDFGDITRGNVLYLPVLSSKNDLVAYKIFQWFNDNLVFIGSNISKVSSYDSIVEQLEDPSVKNSVIKLLKIADFNIHDIDIRTKTMIIPEDFKEIFKVIKKLDENDEISVDDEREIKDIYTIYKGEDNRLIPIHVDSFESRGTKKMLLIATVLVNALRNDGQTIFIDEFDNAFHLAISTFLLKVINSKDFNVNSQFILNTHELSLLKNDVLRVDQIWFTEKNKANITDIYSLYDFNDTNNRSRQDVSYASDYLNGKYGAWPIVNERALEDLLEEVRK